MQSMLFWLPCEIHLWSLHENTGKQDKLTLCLDICILMYYCINQTLYFLSSHRNLVIALMLPVYNCLCHDMVFLNEINSCMYLLTLIINQINLFIFIVDNFVYQIHKISFYYRTYGYSWFFLLDFKIGYTIPHIIGSLKLYMLKSVHLFHLFFIL